MAVRFGVHAGLHHTSIGDLQALWRRIEDAGFDWISVWDHFYAADMTGGYDCLEAVATHTALACATERVRCGSLVYSVGYRPPAVLAKAMATIDQLSGGRVTLGLGAGWHVQEYEAYGFDFLPGPARLRQLEESITCVRGLLTEEVTDFDGEFFRLHQARLAPAPVQERLPIWVGGGGEQVTMRIAARHADGWNVAFVPPDVYRHKVGVLRGHCEREGRDPAEVEPTVNVGLAWSEEELAAQFGPLSGPLGPGVLTGGTQEVVDRVGAYVDAGATWVILAVRAPFDAASLERFAAEVFPAFGAGEQGQ